MIHEYEVVVIVRPDIDDAETNATFERVAAALAELGGTVVDKEDWGKRKLAYLIKKHAKGHYQMFVTVVSPTAMLELERRMRLDDRIIRFLVVNVAENVVLEDRVAAAEERRKNRPDQRRFDYEEEPEPEDDYDMGDLAAAD